MVFLGYVALSVSPQRHDFREGAVAGTAMCTSSSTFSVWMLEARLGPSNVVSRMSAAVAAVEGALCLTAFTISRHLISGWTAADLSQPAVSGAFLLFLCIILRTAMPSFISYQVPPSSSHFLFSLLASRFSLLSSRFSFLVFRFSFSLLLFHPSQPECLLLTQRLAAKSAFFLPTHPTQSTTHSIYHHPSTVPRGHE